MTARMPSAAIFVETRFPDRSWTSPSSATASSASPERSSTRSRPRRISAAPSAPTTAASSPIPTGGLNATRPGSPAGGEQPPAEGADPRAFLRQVEADKAEYHRVQGGEHDRKRQPAVDQLPDYRQPGRGARSRREAAPLIVHVEHALRLPCHP